MLEWKTGGEGWEDATEGWEASVLETVAPSPSEQPVRRWRRRAGIALGILLVLIAAAALALRWQASRKLAVAKADVQAVVDEEMWALQTGNWELYTALLDRQAPAFWYRERYNRFIQNAQRGAFSATVTDLVLLQPDLALVELRVESPGRPAYREARAYRRVNGRWRWTAAPPDEPWVHAVERETANLRFLYHRDDAERLEPLFPALQQLYAQLLRDFGLAPLPSKRQLQLVLSVLPANEAFVDPGLRYDLSSLAASSDPRELQRALGRQLTDRVLRQFYERAGEMAFVLDGIREWEVADWMGALDPEAEARIVRVLVEKPFVPLSMVEPEQFGPPTLATLTATVVEYLVQRKGRGAIKSLTFGLERDDGWETLISRGVGLPYDDVAARWWEFVAQRYTPSNTSAPEPEDVLAQLKWMLELEQQALDNHDFQLFESLVDPLAAPQWVQNEWDRRLENRRGGVAADPTQIDAWGNRDHGAWVVLRPRLQPTTQSGYFMDLCMPGVDGVTAIHHIKAHHPEIRILVLTTYDTDADILRAIEAGATGYLLKDTGREELARAIRAAARGEAILAPPVAAKLMQQVRAPGEERLSARELEILRLVAQGQSNKEIARHLHISQATVKTHLLHIFEKLGVSDRTAAVTEALRRGYIRLE